MGISAPTTELASAESVVERLYLAVRHLCVAEGDVRARLVISVETLCALRVDEFPERLRADFSWVMAQSTKYPAAPGSRHGTIATTMRRIRNTTGRQIAQRIFAIYSEIQEIRGFPLLA